MSHAFPAARETPRRTMDFLIGTVIVEGSTTGTDWVDQLEAGRTDLHFGGSGEPKRTKITTLPG